LTTCRIPGDLTRLPTRYIIRAGLETFALEVTVYQNGAESISWAE